MYRAALVAGSLLLVAACSMPYQQQRTVGSLLDPYCAPDGSVVRVQYANNEGRYDGAQASPANCPWNKN